jgi:hypothetical protein
MKERRRKLTSPELQQQRLKAFGLTKRVRAPGERNHGEAPSPDDLDYITGERLRQRRLETNP